MKHIFTLILGVFFYTQVHSQSVPSYVPTNGLVGWWGFNGNAQDGSGNGNHGTVNGATLTTDRFGNIGSAYSFQTSDLTHIRVSNNQSLNLIGSFTISAWYLPTDLSANVYPYRPIISKASNNDMSIGGYVMGITSFSSPSVFDLQGGSPYLANIAAGSITNFNLNQWRSIIISYDEFTDSLKYFDNGIIANNFSVALNFQNTSLDLFIGNHFNSNNPNISNAHPWKGDIDDIGIWNRALTPQEITNLYNAQTCQVNITSQPTSQTSQLNNSINFSVTSSDSNSTYRWQTDTGGGFFDLNDGGQYSGASMSVLTISAINLQNHNQSFRCIVSTQNCGSDTSDVATLSVQNPNVLTGTLNYANSSLTPLPGVPVHLRSYLGYVVGSDTTDSLGVFALRGYPNGNYFLDADINYSVNSVNSSDALQTSRFVVLLEMLNNLQQKSADVSGNQRVTSNDALMIRLLSAGVIGQFPVDNFVNTQPSVTFAGGTQSVQILTLASGDVNGNLIVQYNPPILILDTVFSLGNAGTAIVRFPTAGSGVFERGICWGTSPAPTIQNDHVNVGSGGFDFSHSFGGLTGGSTYFVRAYARNPVGIFYSNEVSIIAVSWNRCPGTPTVTDIDGNVYNTVQIGNQCWMQSNLKVSRFRNGDSILTGFSNSDWYNLFNTPAYSIYNNDAQNEIIFGKLYNHVSVRDSREICPTGWHVPTDTEWNVLVKFLDSGSDTSCNNCIQSQIAGGALKSTSILPIQSGWMPPNTGATNSSGFFGTPGGMRDGHTGTFNDLRNVAFWWTSSTSYAGHPARVVVHNAANIYKGGNFHGLYGFSVRCLRDSSAGGGGSASVPSVTTVAISGVSATGALTGGDVFSDGGATVTSRGVAYGLSTNPTTSGNITTDGSGVGSFVSTLSGLTASTTYYARAYATNSVGTAYGNEVTFTTLQLLVQPCPGTPTVTDIDGNIYNTVKIGNQCWMQSNLRTSKYRNGDSINSGLNNNDWNAATTGAYGQQNLPGSLEYYGNLYNHYAVSDNRGLCPTGWRVPTIQEWFVLADFLGGQQIAGGKLKQALTQPQAFGWDAPNIGATNESGYSAYGAGFRDIIGHYSLANVGTFFWSSSVFQGRINASYAMSLFYSNAIFSVYDYTTYSENRNGFSVRCLRDTSAGGGGSASVPSVTTVAISGVSSTGASTGGDVTSDGGSPVTSRGVAYGLTSNPTTSGTITTDGSGVGSFVSTLTGLTSNTQYHVRAYAINSVGTAYGNEVTFTTLQLLVQPCPGTPTVTDIDGNIYNTVKIGNQCWMQSNLKVSRYNNGDSIVGRLNNWGLNNLGAFAIYDNNLTYDTLFGKLYNHYAVSDVRRICPIGWKVPSNSEIDCLINHSNGLGSHLKSRNTYPSPNGWAQPNLDATDSLFFMALPGGLIGDVYGNNTYSSFYAGFSGHWWTSTITNTDAYGFTLYSNIPWIYPGLSNRTLGFSVRCLRDSLVGGGGSASVPSVTTLAISGVTSTGASTGGDVPSDGGSAVTSRGVAYGLSTNPTTLGTITTDGSGVGSFVSTLTGLTASTTYYVRAYAINGVGTAYGNEISFSTNTSNGYSSCGGVTDVDGNSYQTVQIGTQCWTQSNLKVSKYRNGDNIPTGLSNSAWQYTTAGAFAIYDNNPLNDGLYGKLYNHFSVMDSRGLCPTGWHVPSDVEWTTLTTHLGGAGGAMKSTTGWTSPNTGATNSSGFTGLPGGYRHNYGGFSYVGYYGYWWSSSGTGSGAAWSRVLVYYNADVYRYNFYVECIGFSVRCIRD